MKYSPIIIIAFNRLNVLKNTVMSLLENPESAESDLFVFVDGARENKEGEKEKVQAVQEYVKTIKGFKSLTYTFSEKNKGLADSVIDASTEILKMYGRVILVEDDLYCSKSFLCYMNMMLNMYEYDNRIMQISGYSSKLHLHKSYPWEIYLSGRAHSWSWATWKDRWDTVDWEVRDFDQLAKDKKAICAFNTYGSDLFGMLKGWKEKRNNSWYIRFNYSMHKQGRYCICPIKSLVRNDGFGIEATNCISYDRYKITFDEEHKWEFKIPNRCNDLKTNRLLMKHAVRYWSIPYRIFGKIMTILTRFFNTKS